MCVCAHCMRIMNILNNWVKSCWMAENVISMYKILSWILTLFSAYGWKQQQKNDNNNNPKSNLNRANFLANAHGINSYSFNLCFSSISFSVYSKMYIFICATIPNMHDNVFDKHYLSLCNWIIMLLFFSLFQIEWIKIQGRNGKNEIELYE